MTAVTQEPRIDLTTLRQTLQAVEPAVLLIEPRILRRVIKQDRRLAGLGLHVPHRKAYTIQRDRLLVIADRAELDLAPGDDLPRKVILLAHPTDGDYLENAPAPDVLHAFWRLLFHARVHMWMEQRVAAGELSEHEIFRRRRAIGPIEFEEIRSVLDKDDMLLPPQDDRETYVEFLAVYLELRYFAPKDLAAYFPAVRDWQAIDLLASEDVDHERLYRETRLPGAATLSRGARALLDDGPASVEKATGGLGPLQPSPPQFWRLAARAERAGAVGNGVKAAILRTRARRLALPERAVEMQAAAHAELQRLVDRLGAALVLPPDVLARWTAALTPLLDRAERDRWSAEVRLLYDLQNVCIEHERGVYRLDAWGWLRSWGERPLRKPLPLLRQVLITKHLRTAARRISTLRVDVASREKLASLLDDAFARMENQMRTDLRPIIAGVLDREGLVAQTATEHVARRKIIEELLDRIVERGFINMGDLRDAISKNHLKMPDLSGVRETLIGDQLLRSDRQLAQRLEGVYRPGAVYLRIPQSLSSLAFGTPLGRFLTQFVVLPFGGAYLALSGLVHLIEGVVHVGAEIILEDDTALHDALAESVTTGAASLLASPWDPSGPISASVAATLAARASLPPESHASQWPFYGAVAALGTLILLLIHRPAFRQGFVRAVVRLLHYSKIALIDWPTRIIHSPIVRKILQSQVYRVIHSYLVRPAIFSSIVLWPQLLTPDPWDWSYSLNVFLALNLFLNSPIGRYADERFTDILVRAWHELRMRVLAAVFQWIMDVFHQVLETIERILYMVDEWLRFRRGDSRVFLVVKFAFGPIWSAVRYIIRIYVTLLIEPQVNPIKHFPVVTVSHKIMLPYSIILTRIFAAPIEPFVGTVLANTFAAATVLLLPGVFGFLVWELKENWRLYAANRPANLTPARIGHHGETMIRFLRPGFHSGTLPKRFSRLRQACREAGEAGDWKLVNQHKAALHHIEESLRRFFSREFCTLLEEEGTLQFGAVETGEIHLATNRIDVEFFVRPRDSATGHNGAERSRRHQGESLWLVFEQRGNWLVASVRVPGWLHTLPPAERQLVDVALAGLYKIAAVDLIRERLEREFEDQGATIEVTETGFAVYRDGTPEGRVDYPLRRAPLRLLAAREEPAHAQRKSQLEPRSLVFSDTPISWHHWVEFWESEKRTAAQRATNSPWDTATGNPLVHLSEQQR